MATDIKVPDLGDGIDTGDVLEVFVSVGDVIEKDADLIELETDKATVTVPASTAGKVTKVHVSEGDTIAVGGVIVSVEAASGAKEAPEKKSPAPKKPAKKQAPPAKPDVPEPHASQTPVPVDPPKPQPKPKKQQAAPVAASTAVPASAPAVSSSNGAKVAAGPAIRRLAREVGIDLSKVTGSGDFGRITREDVMKAVRGGGVRKSASAVGAGGETDAYGPIRTEKMSKIRQTIARKMHESWETAPRVTNFDDADVTDLEEIRQNSKSDYAARDIKLTTMPFIIKAVAMSLKAHPVVNASIDLDVGQVIYKDYVNIGIAVDTERGLVVPALRNVDRMAIPDIARSLSEMAVNVRENNFSVNDLRGGTFTISNLGAIGGTYSTPIINVPETAILLIGRSRKMPVVIEDQIQIRLMMPLSISYDHRLIDGAAAARFLNEVKGYLEAPSRLLLAL